MVSAVSIRGNTALTEDALKQSLGLQPGGPYIDTQLALDRDALQLRYLDLGYAKATVEAEPNFSADRTTAQPTFIVHEDVRVFVDHVLIVGNLRASTDLIAREVRIKPGDTLSESAKIDSRRRLAALGLFRRVQIAELDHGDEASRDILVTVEEAQATTVVFGAGMEGRALTVRRAEDAVASEQFEFAPRGSFEISRRNLFGKNRSVSLFSSVSLVMSILFCFICCCQGRLGSGIIKSQFCFCLFICSNLSSFCLLVARNKIRLFL